MVLDVHEGRIEAGDLDIHNYVSIVMGDNGIMDLITKLKDILTSVSSSIKVRFRQ